MDKEVINAAKHCVTKDSVCVECPLIGTHDCKGFLIRSLIKAAGNKMAVLKSLLELIEPGWNCCKPEKATRSYILDKAKEIVNGHREQEYGSPENNFSLIGDLWSVLLGVDIPPDKVALMMIMMKAARIKTGTSTEDSWIDIAGYAACGGEIANHVAKKTNDD